MANVKSVTDKLDLNEPLFDKWVKLMDIPIIKVNTVVVQNYYTGRLKLMSRSGSAASTAPLAIELRGKVVKTIAPAWRELARKSKDTSELWKAQTYGSYYENRAVRARSDYNKHAGAVAVNGGEVKDIDLLEDRRLLERAVKANRAVVERDNCAKRARSYQTKSDQVTKYLADIANAALKERDVHFIRESERTILNEELARETARQMIRGNSDSTRSNSPREKIL